MFSKIFGSLSFGQKVASALKGLKHQSCLALILLTTTIVVVCSSALRFHSRIRVKVPFGIVSHVAVMSYIIKLGNINWSINLHLVTTPLTTSYSRYSIFIAEKVTLCHM